MAVPWLVLAVASWMLFVPVVCVCSVGQWHPCLIACRVWSFADVATGVITHCGARQLAIVLSSPPSRGRLNQVTSVIPFAGGDGRLDSSVVALYHSWSSDAARHSARGLRAMLSMVCPYRSPDPIGVRVGRCVISLEFQPR